MTREGFTTQIGTIHSDEDALHFLEGGERLTNDELKQLLNKLHFEYDETQFAFNYNHTNHDEIITFIKSQLNDPAYKTAGQVLRILKEVLGLVKKEENAVSPEEQEALLKKMGIKGGRKKSLLETIESNHQVSAEEAVKTVLKGKRNPNSKGRTRQISPKGLSRLANKRKPSN